MQIMPASMHFALDCMQGWTGRLEGATFCGTRGDAVAAGVDRATSNREELSNVYENACALFHHGHGGGLGRGRPGRCGRDRKSVGEGKGGVGGVRLGGRLVHKK